MHGLENTNGCKQTSGGAGGDQIGGRDGERVGSGRRAQIRPATAVAGSRRGRCQGRLPRTAGAVRRLNYITGTKNRPKSAHTPIRELRRVHLPGDDRVPSPRSVPLDARLDTRLYNNYHI